MNRTISTNVFDPDAEQLRVASVGDRCWIELILDKDLTESVTFFLTPKQLADFGERCLQAAADAQEIPDAPHDLSADSLDAPAVLPSNAPAGPDQD